MPKDDEECEELQDDPQYLLKNQPKQKTLKTKVDENEAKQHVVGLVGNGQILGIEELCLGKHDHYTQSVVCFSQQAELWQIDKDIFSSILKQT